MSLHPVHVPTRDEVIAATSKPIPKRLSTIALVLTVVGLLAFVLGLFLAPDRAWRAFHVNWLFWAALSTAGVMFVAVQRITTARWSRSVIRFMEGYVAFLPVAFLLLLVTLAFGTDHVFPWSHEAPPVHEKEVYFDRTFLTLRDILAFGILTAMSIWYIYTSVRLDVGNVAESGASWARGLRERMRRGYRDERREIHSTHSLQGKLAIWLGFAFTFGWSVLAWDLSMGMSLHFQSALYSWWFFMGGWLGRSLASVADGAGTVLPLTNGIWFWSVVIAGIAWTLVQRHGKSEVAAPAPLRALEPDHPLPDAREAPRSNP